MHPDDIKVALLFIRLQPVIITLFKLLTCSVIMDKQQIHPRLKDVANVTVDSRYFGCSPAVFSHSRPSH